MQFYIQEFQKDANQFTILLTVSMMHNERLKKNLIIPDYEHQYL